jgi:hypothetical protein
MKLLMQYCFKSGILLIFLLACFPLRAQKLRIQNISIPDSVLLGSNITAGFTIAYDDSVSLLGDMRIWFGNPELGDQFAPLGFFSSRQFFAPGQQRDFEITIPIRPDLFKGGGNTVVIWPSFIDKPEIGADSTFLDIFVVNPNSSTGIESIARQLKIIHLPYSDLLEVQRTAMLPELASLILFDGCGRILKQGTGNRLLLPEIGEGIYILELHFKNGMVSRHKIYWSAR